MIRQVPPSFLNKKESKARREIRERRLGIPPTPKEKSTRECLREEKKHRKLLEEKYKEVKKGLEKAYARSIDSQLFLQDEIDKTFEWWKCKGTPFEDISDVIQPFLLEKRINLKKSVIVFTLIKKCVDEYMRETWPENTYLDNITNITFLEFELISNELDSIIQILFGCILRKIERILEDIENGFYKNWWST